MNRPLIYVRPGEGGKHPIELCVIRQGEPFIVEEGLFYALQEAGWYHPYTMTWRWTTQIPR